MLNRFSRIQNNYGTMAMARMLLLVVGLGLMIAIGFIGLSSPLAAYITVIGLALGFLLKKIIPFGARYYQTVIRFGLYAYGVILVVGHWIDLDRNIEIAIITATTVVIFNLNFWTLSNPEIDIAAIMQFLDDDVFQDLDSDEE